MSEAIDEFNKVVKNTTVTLITYRIKAIDDFNHLSLMQEVVTMTCNVRGTIQSNTSIPWKSQFNYSNRGYLSPLVF